MIRVGTYGNADVYCLTESQKRDDWDTTMMQYYMITSLGHKKFISKSEEGNICFGTSAPGIRTPAEMGVVEALKLARMGAVRPVTRPVSLPVEEKGFVDWLTRTPLWTPFKTTPTSPTAPPTPTPAAVECPRGLVYDRGQFAKCDPGYYIGDSPGGGIWGKARVCICSAGYIPPHKEQDKTARDVGLSGLGGIVDMLPTIIIGGIVIAAMGMLKK